MEIGTAVWKSGEMHLETNLGVSGPGYQLGVD
jgi:hypothetical protein